MARKDKRGKKRSQEDRAKEQVEEEQPAAEEEKEEGDKKVLSEEEDDEGNNAEAQGADEITDEPTPSPPPIRSDGRYRNKQRCLISCSRGITARFRHLLEDLRTLIPHHKKESKLDPGHDGVGRAITDIAEMRGCNTVLFLECRKRQDAYLWLGRQNGGPSVRFHVSNIHTMDELKMTGNCMKGSRPILSFDESFSRLGHLKLLKELFVDVFGTPSGHPKSKPFVDRIMSFYYADKKIWVRNYQIIEQKAANAMEANATKKKTGGDQDSTTSLVEIGPRFVLNPIRIFRGAFGGQALFHNADFVSPNQVRSIERKEKGESYENRKDAQKKRKLRSEDIVLPYDPLDSVFR